MAGASRAVAAVTVSVARWGPTHRVGTWARGSVGVGSSPDPDSMLSSGRCPGVPTAPPTSTTASETSVRTAAKTCCFHRRRRLPVLSMPTRRASERVRRLHCRRGGPPPARSAPLDRRPPWRPLAPTWPPPAGGRSPTPASIWQPGARRPNSRSGRRPCRPSLGRRLRPEESFRPTWRSPETGRRRQRSAQGRVRWTWRKRSPRKIWRFPKCRRPSAACPIAG
jgi:hypothetical protein